jgi:hypothetical protein
VTVWRAGQEYSKKECVKFVINQNYVKMHGQQNMKFDLFKSEQNYHIGLFFELTKYNMIVSLNHQYRTNKIFAENCVLVVEICHL